MLTDLHTYGHTDRRTLLLIESLPLSWARLITLLAFRVKTCLFDGQPMLLFLFLKIHVPTEAAKIEARAWAYLIHISQSEFVCLSVCLFVCQSFSLLVCLFVRLNVCPFIRLTVCPFVRFSVCPFDQVLSRRETTRIANERCK